MRLISPTIWRDIQRTDEERPLYRKLWFIHYRRSLWAPSSNYNSSMTNILVTVLLSPVFVLVPLLVSPIFGMIWAALIAGMIRFEYQQSRFDLMALFPDGQLGAYRTIALLHLRRSRLFHYLDDALNITTLLGGILLFLLVSGLIVGLASPTVSERESITAILGFIMTVAFTVAGLYTDQIQSVILSFTVGLVVPLYTRGTLEARAWAAAGYIGIQLILYGAAGVVALGVIPVIIPEGIWRSPISILGGGLVLFGLREVVIYQLTAYLARTFGYLLSGKMPP